MSVSRHTRLGLAMGATLLAFASTAVALTIIGTPGDDRIVGSRHADRIAALAGDDVVHAHSGRDRVKAGEGDDRVHGDAHADLLLAGDGEDTQGGDGGSDRMAGGPGDDIQRGGSGNDTILAHAGADRTSGGDGNDDLWGLIKVDVDLEGVDTLAGRKGNDTFHARDGEPDEIDCGRGRDRALLDEQDVIVDAKPTNLNGSCEVVLRAAPTGEEKEPQLR